MDLFKDELKDRLGQNLKFDVLLKDHTTIGTGGVADYFFTANKIEQLIEAVKVANNLGLPVKVIGGGSNILFSDSGFRGMVIKNLTENIVISRETGEVIADSGIMVSKLINLLVSSEMGGIEFMAGVPGTLGGAVYGNAGSASQYIGDYIKGVTILECGSNNIEIVNRDHQWLDFYYRSSKLKRSNNNSVILTVQMRMAQKRSDEIVKRVQENLFTRKEKQPLGERSCGSWFKNPGKLPEQSAGFLLDKSGAKRLKVGGAAVSKKHANFIVNKANATSNDIKRLAELAKDSVKNNFGIVLEEEVEYCGDW